jgi:hypothetical protein
MTGLLYLIESSNFAGINRAECPTLKGKILFSGCENHEPLTFEYQELGYPFGKTKRGLKKWFKNKIKCFGMYQLECSECGEPVWDYPLFKMILSKLYGINRKPRK